MKKSKFHFWTSFTFHFAFLGSTFIRDWPKTDSPVFRILANFTQKTINPIINLSRICGLNFIQSIIFLYYSENLFLLVQISDWQFVKTFLSVFFTFLFVRMLQLRYWFPHPLNYNFWTLVFPYLLLQIQHLTLSF